MCVPLAILNFINHNKLCMQDENYQAQDEQHRQADEDLERIADYDEMED